MWFTYTQTHVHFQFVLFDFPPFHSFQFSMSFYRVSFWMKLSENICSEFWCKNCMEYGRTNEIDKENNWTIMMRVAVDVPCTHSVLFMLQGCSHRYWAVKKRMCVRAWWQTGAKMSSPLITRFWWGTQWVRVMNAINVSQKRSMALIQHIFRNIFAQGKRFNNTNTVRSGVGRKALLSVFLRFCVHLNECGYLLYFWLQKRWK